LSIVASVPHANTQQTLRLVHGELTKEESFHITGREDKYALSYVERTCLGVRLKEVVA